MPIDKAPAAARADSLVLSGLDAHRAGQLDAAGALYAEALAIAPNHADALNLAGVLEFSRGRVDRAIKSMGKAIAAKPDHLDAHLNLAEACEAAGRRKDALAACHKALLVAPDFVDAHARLALLTAIDGEAGRALAHARVALALDPACVEALCGQAMALGAMKNFREADAVYERALQLAPDDARALTGRAALLQERNFVSEAIVLYKRALALEPDNVRLLATLGHLSEVDGDIQPARQFYARALELDGGSASIRFSFARLLRDTGEFTEAEQQFNQILKTSPTYAPAALALVRMKRWNDLPGQRNLLARIATDPKIEADHRIQAGFALGEILERAGDHDVAFARYTAANTLQGSVRARAGESFERAELQDQLEAIESHLGSDYAAVATRWGNPTELPVFVVGLPRSGTSLVEQICSGHSRIAGLGELRAITRIDRVLSEHNVGQERLADWDAIHARAEADAHAEVLASRSAGAIRAIDKNPHNILNLGLIEALYPNARVIRCHRDQRDVAISNFTLFFKRGNPYSNDQADCGFAVRMIDRIGNSWSRHLNLRILDVSYEDLVHDVEATSRRMIEFLDLPWDDACLNFQNTRRHVGTPSSWQVRQPIYDTSIGRWRKFEKHLGPMLAELAPQSGT